MAVHTVAGFTATDIQNAFTAVASDGDQHITVYFPDGTYNWNTKLELNDTIPSTCIDFVFEGQSAAGTILEDNYNSNAHCFSLSFYNFSTNVRIRFRHFTFKGGASAAQKNPVWYIGAYTNNFRMHDVIFDNSVGVGHGSMVRLQGYIRGVIDHCTVTMVKYAPSAVFTIMHTAIDGTGDYLWSQPTPYGGPDMMYIEDCTISAIYDGNLGTLVNDGYYAATTAMRFNTLFNCGFETHPTTNRDRGARHMEMYCNDVDCDSDLSHGALFGVIFMSSGTMICWNNPVATNGFSHFCTVHANARDNQSYGRYSAPTGWGFSGTSFLGGTVNTSGTLVTKTSGNPWAGGSGQGSYTVVAGSKINIAGTEYTIAALTDATHMTLTTSAGTHTGQTSFIVSNWCGDPSGSSGYPTMDQPGRGRGDRLSGDFPNVINVDNSNADWTSPDAYPDQDLEPMYFWQCPWTTAGGGLFIAAYNSDCTVENRDYYLENSSYASGGGATGIGIGTRSEMDAVDTPTDGTAFWVTNEGSWNAGSNSFYTGQGRLYKRVSGSWVQLWEPYQYPHPLIVGDTGGASVPRKTRVGKISKGRH